MAGITVTNEQMDAGETGMDITPSLTADNRPPLVLIEDELMTVSAGTSSLTVARGAYGTTDAVHTTTKQVYEVLKVQQRADSLLVYYYDSNEIAIKRIVISDEGSTALPTTASKSDGDLLKVDDQENAVWDTPTIDVFDTAANIEAVLSDAGIDKLYIKEMTFTETAAAGTYTGVPVAVPSGARLVDAEWETTATFDADTAVLDVGHTGDADAFIDGKNVKTAGRGVMDGTGLVGLSAGGQGYKFTGADSITAVLVTTGTGGATGRLRLLLTLSQPSTATAAVKS